eukprot:14103727-Ditylum_brightwellii.AAC.1
MSERVCCNKNYVPMNRQCIVRFATTQQISQLMLVTENKMTYNKDNKPQWKNDGKDRKFTPALARTKSGGWNQEGLNWYHELLEREKLERKELKEKYKDNPHDWPDYMKFPRL